MLSLWMGMYFPRPIPMAENLLPMLVSLLVTSALSGKSEALQWGLRSGPQTGTWHLCPDHTIITPLDSVDQLLGALEPDSCVLHRKLLISLFTSLDENGLPSKSSSTWQSTPTLVKWLSLVKSVFLLCCDSPHYILDKGGIPASSSFPLTQQSSA